MSPTDAAGTDDMSLTVLMIVSNQDRSRDFYHDVMGAEIVRDRDPAILRLGNGVIVLNVGGGPPTTPGSSTPNGTPATAQNGPGAGGIRRWMAILNKACSATK